MNYSERFNFNLPDSYGSDEADINLISENFRKIDSRLQRLQVVNEDVFGTNLNDYDDGCYVIKTGQNVSYNGRGFKALTPTIVVIETIDNTKRFSILNTATEYKQNGSTLTITNPKNEITIDRLEINTPNDIVSTTYPGAVPSVVFNADNPIVFKVNNNDFTFAETTTHFELVGKDGVCDFIDSKLHKLYNKVVFNASGSIIYDDENATLVRAKYLVFDAKNNGKIISNMFPEIVPDDIEQAVNEGTFIRTETDSNTYICFNINISTLQNYLSGTDWTNANISDKQEAINSWLYSNELIVYYQLNNEQVSNITVNDKIETVDGQTYIITTAEYAINQQIATAYYYNDFDDILKYLYDKKIKSIDIENGAVTSNKINDGAITTSKIGNGAITADKIASNAVTSDKIAIGAVTSEKISDKSINLSKLDDNLANKIGKYDNEWQLIETIKVNEDTQAITRDNYDYYEMMVHFNMAAGTAGTVSTTFKCVNGNISTVGVLNMIHSTNRRYSIMAVFNFCGKRVAMSMGGGNSQHAINSITSSLADRNITSISITGSETVPIPAGSIIEIWGKK